jgi:hypothetical protein
MVYWHPLAAIPWAWQVGLLVAACLASLGLMRKAGPPQLRADGLVPGGIVDLELAGTEEVARNVIAKWSDWDVKDLARASVYWDFGLIVGYGLATTLACLLLSRYRSPLGLTDPRLATILAWGVVIAMICDVVENVGLLWMLSCLPSSGTMGIWPCLTQICAVAKFILLFAAWYYCLWGLVSCGGEWVISSVGHRSAA